MATMRRQLVSPLLSRRLAARSVAPYVCSQCRAIQISASPTSGTPSESRGDGLGAGLDAARDSADARFEVLGSPYSLLSVTLSASQNLYTRRGTLVSVAGKVENAQSTLSLLPPFSRSLLGIPFLYQRVNSTTPLTALIATSSPNTTFSLLHLDGTTDYIVAQRKALLAWTGHSLAITPRLQRGLSVAHWGNSYLSGRGLVALASPGNIYMLTLAEGEELVLQPAHVVAYAVNKNPPLPFRLRSSGLRLQIPPMPAFIRQGTAGLVPGRLARFWADMRDTRTFKFIAALLFNLRTTARRSIWGDRLFLQFRGPTTILMSSRGARVRDVLSREDVNEIADVEAGVVPAAVELATKPAEERRADNAGAASLRPSEVSPPRVRYVEVKGGKVTFEDSKDLGKVVR